MVIQKCPVNEIPVGAIRLSEKDALQHIWKEINGWKNSLDVYVCNLLLEVKF